MNALPPAAVPIDLPTDSTGASARNRGLFLIAVFNLIKAALFVVAAAGVFHLVNRDTHVELSKLLHAFRLDGDRAFLKNLLLKANVITDPTKRILGGVLLLYAGMYAIEGVGLWLRKRWAEYFTAAMTALPLPLEVYMLVHHTTHSEVSHLVSSEQQVTLFASSHVFVLKIAALAINAAMLVYLVYHLWRGGKHVHR